MSGGVGPTGDIKLPPDEETVMKSLNSITQSSKTKTKTPSLLSPRHLYVLAVVVVLSSTGMVSIADFSFVLFSLVYVFFLSKIAFPFPDADTDTSPIFGEKNRVLGIYVLVGALIGLFLPILYIFHGIIQGDKEGIRAAAPHLFLLASQVFMEGVTFSGKFSIPIRVFVPVFYNTKRVFTIVDWLRAEIGKVDVEDGGSHIRLVVGRCLAVANMAFWCFNLFGFLLPVYLPRAFKRYYAAAGAGAGAGAGANKLKD